MKIANGVEMLDLTMQLLGPPSKIHSTLVWDNDTVILVDTGVPVAEIRKAMDQAGVSFDKLNKVIITHQDFDHIGGVPGVLQECARIQFHKIEVLAHEVEKPYIQGEKSQIKMTPERMKQILNSIPEERRTALKAVFENLKAKVDKTVVDGEELPYCGGITIIHTPGHTPGHICLYHKQSKTLITGDAMNIVEGRLFGPNPQYTYDLDSATKSLKKLTVYDIETVICYHGGLYKDRVNQRIAELAEGVPFN